VTDLAKINKFGALELRSSRRQCLTYTKLFHLLCIYLRLVRYSNPESDLQAVETEFETQSWPLEAEMLGFAHKSRRYGEFAIFLDQRF
jgi:hypothetical protein